MELKRCAWAENDPLLRKYHDEEWGVPETGSRALWEKLILDGFQAGLSWLVILRKRDAFRKAFRGFEPAVVARFTEGDVLRLMNDPAIVRSRSKIQATIGNARAFLSMKEQGEDFSTFVWRMAGGAPILNSTGVVQTRSALSEELSAALKLRGFQYVGPVIVYAWMQATGIVNDHALDCYLNVNEVKQQEPRAVSDIDFE